MTTKPSNTRVVSMFVSVAATNLTHMNTCLHDGGDGGAREGSSKSLLPCAQWSACATMAGVQQISAMEIIGTSED